MRVVLYAVVDGSGGRAGAEREPGQLAALRDEACRRGYEVVAEVTDGWPPGGDTPYRPGLARVRRLVAGGGVSVVLGFQRGCFSASGDGLLLLAVELHASGCELRTLEDSGPDPWRRLT